MLRLFWEVRMRTAGISWMVAAVVWGTAGVAAAEQTVYLKDGTVLHGDIVSASGGVTTVQTSMGRLEVKDETIQRVEYGSGAAGTAAP
ncbi:MAG TPA: hypothetical protein VMV18_06070, partial [bacterium]|nr:hypothetical protein [bacterium]